MHHTGLDAFTARPAPTATERRTVALAAYDAAKLDPVADWRAIADMLEPGANTKELAIQARVAEAAADGADFAELRSLETDLRRPPCPPVSAIMRTYLGSTSRVALCVVAGGGEVAA